MTFEALMPVAMVVNLTAVVLTLRWHKLMMRGPLNAEGERRLQGVPADPMAMINSGGPAMRVLAILFTRAYAGFGHAGVVAAGNRALLAQLTGLTVMITMLSAGLPR